MRAIRNSARVLLPLLVLTGCATAPPAIDMEEVRGAWQRHAAEVATLDHWFLKGRVALRTPEDGWSASLHWRQLGGQFNLRLIAPLGQGTIELFGRTDGQVTLVDSENQRYTAADAETLMRETLGWSVPVAGLTYWVRGLPARDGKIQMIEPDAEGRLRALEQSGWQLEIEDYTHVLGRDLPKKLTVSNDQLTVKLVVQSWEQLDAPGS